MSYLTSAIIKNSRKSKMNRTNNQFAANTTTNLVLAGTTAILSMLGSMFIIIAYLRWVTIQTNSRRILFYISVADFFLALGNFVGIFLKFRVVCLVQSIVVSFSSLSSFFWTVIMAVYLYLGCSRRKFVFNETLFCIFHAIGWGVPFVITTIAASTAKLGYNADIVTSGWCWVSVRLGWKEMIDWMLLTGKLWEILAYFIITILYILVKRAIRRQYREQALLDEEEGKAKRLVEMKLIIVPLVFVTLHIWGTIRFFLFEESGPAVDPPNTTWLLYFQGVGDNGQGFANFLIFCFFTEKTKREIQSCCRKCFRRFRRIKARLYESKPCIITSPRVTIEPKVKYDPIEYTDIS